MRNRNKKKELNKKLLVALPIVLMFASLFGVMLYNPSVAQGSGAEEQPGAFEINGYTFYPVSSDDVYETRVLYENRYYAFRVSTDPRNATLMHMDKGIPDKIFSSEKLYISFNPNQDELGYFGVAAYQIASITQTNNIYTKGTYTEDSNPIDPYIPLKTCNDATEKDTVMILEIKENVPEGAFLKDNCIFITANKGSNLLLIADKVRLNLVGIDL